MYILCVHMAGWVDMVGSDPISVKTPIRKEKGKSNARIQVPA